ncbi:chromosome partition protein MukF [Klebsiella pneumoniae]|uniref:Chromosome partition protein MukF n=1 Tax=Klebsiella pneumoniae TaxID=573 RepID=A0A3S4GM18_KLEPN|nr:chromosome partition protein MukF [Klebsiella pneumoniae]
MEQLRTELSHLLGEKLSRVECVSEQAATALWFLYDAQGNPMPLLARSFTTPGVARSFTTPGVARQLAWKISTLARNGTVRMPVVLWRHDARRTSRTRCAAA